MGKPAKTFSVITIFPEMIESPFKLGVISKAIESGLIAVNGVNLRDFADGRHKVTDDYQYGGGAGLVMKPEPICRAVNHLRESIPADASTRVILMDPRGIKFDQKVAERFSSYDNLIFICGRYEGVDERVRELVVDEAVSVGDYILTGGELAAMNIIDATARLVPGVLGDETSIEEESFTTGKLEYPHYTRPVEYEGLKVPDVLTTGNHADIVRWRAEQSILQTNCYRPELLPLEAWDENYKKSVYETTAVPKGRKVKFAVALMHYPMRDKQGDVVTTSITNMDLHDISRSAATYGAQRYFVITPLKAQREIASRVIEHWTKGFGADYNANRKEAFMRTELCDSLLVAIKELEDEWGEKPLIIATTARRDRANISAKMLGDIAEKRGVLILFGTGWGFVDEVFELADHVLEPIQGASDFNHLSVRSAAAILFERLTKV